MVPQMNPSSSYVITCNLINNPLSNPSNVLSSFTTGGTSFGGLIIPNTDVIYSKIKEGTYKDIIISIKDQDFNELIIKDSSMLIVLSILKESL